MKKRDEHGTTYSDFSMPLVLAIKKDDNLVCYARCHFRGLSAAAPLKEDSGSSRRVDLGRDQRLLAVTKYRQGHNGDLGIYSDNGFWTSEQSTAGEADMEKIVGALAPTGQGGRQVPVIGATAQPTPHNLYIPKPG